MRTSIACASILLLVTSVFGQERKPIAESQLPREKRGLGASGAEARATDALRLRIESAAFDEVPLEQVLGWLTEQTGCNVVIRWEQLLAAGVQRDKPVTLKCRNLALDQVLWLVLREAGGQDAKLAYSASGSVLMITTDADLSRDMVTKVYDVRDLLVTIPQFRNAARVNAIRALDSAAAGAPSGCFTSASEDDTDRNGDGDDDPAMSNLIDVILLGIEPDSWGPGRGSITAIQGRIVVRNSARVHQLLGGPLARMDNR